MSPVDSAEILEGQKFRRNCSISHRFRDKCIYMFYTEIQDGCQKLRENNILAKSPVNSGDTLAIKNFNEIALSHIVPDINVFLRFNQKFKMATKNGRKMISGKNHQLTLLLPCLGVKFFDQIAVSHTVSQINAFLRFTQKFKTAAKNGRKTIFGKTRQLTLGIPWNSKILTKSLTHRFRDSYTFLFSAKIHDSRHKLRKLKFFSFQ